MDILKRAFGTADAETFAEYPLSGDSPELHELLAGYLGIATNGLANVDEAKAMSIPAFARADSLISGTIAGLPLKTYTKTDDGSRSASSSVFDRPQGPFAIDTFSWVAMVISQMVRFQVSYLQAVTNGAGALVGFWPVHPTAVSKVEWNGPNKLYTVHYAQGSDKVFGTPEAPTDAGYILEIAMGDSWGLRPKAVWDQHRAVFQTAVAAEQAAARVFTGALIRGLVTTAADEELDPDDPEGEAKAIMDKLNARIAGVENANQMAFVNRHLTFSPWQMTNADAQFIETRTFAIEEMARITGLPPHLLAAIDKQTSWGTGISEQNIGLARYRLMDFTSRFESAALRVLPEGEYIEFDYKGLLQGSPADEIHLIIDQVAARIMSPEYAATLLQLPAPPKPVAPAPTGDTTNG